MFNLIVKFDNGGVIDVDSLRTDVKNDPRYFDKKKGVFTKSGKERLAAIEEINSVQEKGLKYSINDKEATFKIVDKSGNTVNPNEGRGVEIGKSISPFYGLINKEKRSKKEVSSILSNVKFKSEPDITEKIKERVSASENKTSSVSEQKPNVAVIGTQSVSSTPNKGNELTEKKEEVKSTTSKTSSTNVASFKNAVDARAKFNAQTNKNVSDSGSILSELDKFIPETEIDKKDHTDLKNKLTNVNIYSTDRLSPEEYNELSSAAYKLKSMKEVLKNGAKPFPDFNQMRKDLMIERDSIVNSKEDPLIKSKKLEKVDQDLKSIRNAVPSIQDIEEVRNNYRNTLKDILPKYKAMMSRVFGDAITNQKQVMSELETDKYSKPIKAAYQPQFQNSINSLEKLRDEYENMSEEDIIDKLIGGFGRKITTHKIGGRIPIFQIGGITGQENKGELHISYNNDNNSSDYESMSRNGENPFLQDLEVILSQGAKEGQPIYGPDNLPIGLRKPLEQKNSGTGQILKGKKSFFKQDQGTDPTKKSGITISDIKRGLGKTFSTNQINTPLGNIQYNDILQFILLNKAHKKPVATVQPLQTIYREHGSRNVQAARDIDASSIQAAKNAIASLNSDYKGSDPVLSILSKSAVQGKKLDMTNDLISRRADYRRGEEDRVNAEMEEKRLQGADDLQNITKNVNFNKEQQYNANIATAKALADKESAYMAGIGTLGRDIQTRWNQQAESKKQYLAGVAATDRQFKIENAYVPLMNAKAEKARLEIDYKYAKTPEEKEKIKGDWDKINALHTQYENEYNEVKSETTDAEDMYDNISKGSPLLDLSTYKGKNKTSK